MRANLLKIRNILCHQELDIKLGPLTIIQGENATGKTAVIESLKAGLGGGHDATLIREGCDHSEIVIVLEEDIIVERRIGQDRSPVTVTHPRYGKISKPQAYLDRLMDVLSFNPVSFLTAPPDKRAQWLLEILPLEVDPQQLQAAAGILLDKADLRPNALDTINHVRQKVYDFRTGVNRVADEKQKTITSLEASLPEQTTDDCETELRQVQSEHDELVTKLAEGMSLSQQFEAAEIQKLREAAQAEIDAIKIKLDKDLQALRRECAEGREQAREDAEPRIGTLKAQVGRLQERAKAARDAENTRAMVARFRQEHEEAEAESKRLTTGLKNLDALKLQLLQSLPIKGLEVRDGQVYKDGIPFERVNRAKQVAVALQIAKLRAGDLALVCVDNLECLDDATFKAFERAAVASGLQLVVTRVTEGPLTIETRGEGQ